MSFEIIRMHQHQRVQPCISINKSSIYINVPAIDTIKAFIGFRPAFCQLMIDRDHHQLGLHFTNEQLPNAHKVSFDKNKARAGYIALNNHDTQLINHEIKHQTHFYNFTEQLIDGQKLVIL